MIKELEYLIRKKVKYKDTAIKIIELYSIIIFPILIALIFAFRSHINYWLLLLTFLIILQLFFGGILLFKPRILEKFYFDYLDLNNNYKNTKESKDDYEEIVSVLYYMSIALSKFIEDHKSNTLLDNSVVESGVDNMLTALIDFRKSTFNFKTNARYNFAVYLYSESEDKLKKFFRQNDDRISVRNREWSPGVGHIGMCYSNKMTMICKDILKSTELLVVDDDDKKNYRCLASTPIYYKREDENVRGVFIVTSSEPNQFEPVVHSPILDIISSYLTIYFKFTDTKIGGRNYV